MSLGIHDSRAGQQPSPTFIRMWMQCLWQKHMLQRKKAFPRLHQLPKAVGAAAITVTHVSHFLCKLWVASPFVGEKAVAGKQGNLDFVPTLALQCSPSCSGVRPPGGGPSPAFTEIKATLLGEISDLLQVFFQGTNQFVKCSF